MSPRLSQRLVRWLYENRWLFTVVIAALVVRWHWNTVVHPPGDFYYSDMRGYLRRSEAMFTSLWGAREYDAFYPFGTHVLIYGIMKVLGPGWDATLRGHEAELMKQAHYMVVGKVYAVIGAATVGFTFLLARRVSKWPFVAPAVGTLMVCYYPHIMIGGYFLSEVPFALCLTAASYFLVRLIDDGRWPDAIWCGVFTALGFTVRPQILLSIALFGVFWLVWRKKMPRLRLSRLLIAFIPVLLMLCFSAWRFHYHTGRNGLISENGKFNQVFGRCHNAKIIAEPDGKHGRTSFGPPPLIQLGKRQEQLPKAWPGLDPAFGRKRIVYVGYIGDAEVLNGFIRECVAETGWAKQAEYALVNVLLLWRYNVMWPDSGKGAWREYSRKWGVLHANALAVPAVLAMLAIFFGGWHLRLGVLALHLWAIVIVAIIYIGGARFRSPYDPIIIVMALEMYAVAGWGVWRLARYLLRRRNRGAPDGV